MPIYEYECQACGRNFEVRQSFDDPLLTRCEICSGKLRKLIHAPGIQFKGGGWYVTDYPSADRKKCMENEKKEGDALPAKTKTESSPASSCSETA
jgi:putative FmdB family regulatory protein